MEMTRSADQVCKCDYDCILNGDGRSALDVLTLLYTLAVSLLAQTRQVYRLVVTTRLPTRHITSRLQVHIIVPTLGTLTSQKVQLCIQVSYACLDNCSHCILRLTSPITTPRHRNNRITLQPPCCRIRALSPYQRLVARARSLDVEVCGGVLALDGTADGKSLGRRFGA